MAKRKPRERSEEQKSNARAHRTAAPSLEEAEAMDTSERAVDGETEGAREALMSKRAARRKRKANSMSIGESKPLGVSVGRRKGPQMKRTMKLRKQKALEKAVSLLEKQETRLSRGVVRREQIMTSKALY